MPTRVPPAHIPPTRIHPTTGHRARVTDPFPESFNDSFSDSFSNPFSDQFGDAFGDPFSDSAGRSADDSEITAWALAAGLGDRRAAELFVRATYDDVRRFVAHLSADVRGADDLTQETYLRALASLARFAGRSCARVWLLAIARRVVVDRYRRAAVRPRIADTADWVTVADRAQPRHLPGFEESVALADALAAMDPGRRQAFVLTRLIGLSYAEAADALGCPVGTIRSRVARARRDLAAVWHPEGGESAVTAVPV